MTVFAKNIRVISLIACLVLAVFVASAHAQSLEERLKTETDYVPKASLPLDELIEVARKFKIPMAIEWTERPGTMLPDKTLSAAQRSVRKLIEEIAGVSQHRVDVVGGLVRIYSPNEAVHPLNFLNIQLNSFEVTDGDLFDAENQLRWAIRFTLEPERYRRGFGGGYGHGANHVFEISKFTITASDITIREVLNRIALAQGNAFWVATIRSTDLARGRPLWKGTEINPAILPITNAWRFLPLAEIPELAKEQVAVDVMVKGILDQRMNTIPVILENGLAADCCGGGGGVSSEGIEYRYGAHIEALGKDFVTISIHLTVERPGEANFDFAQKIQVYRDRITDLQPEPRIQIRAYFERTQQPKGN